MPILICLTGLLHSSFLEAAETRKVIASFDLFTFPTSSLELSLGQRAQALGKALTGTLPKIFSKYNFIENAYQGACFKTAGDLIRLAWFDSETEGFRFSIEKLTNEKTCTSPFSEGIVFKTYPLDPKAFFPISHGHPTLELGSTTAAQIQSQLGTPDYSSGEKLIYVLKRDKDKEEGCGANPRMGDFYAIEVIFDLKQGKLSAIWLTNTIAGEC